MTIPMVRTVKASRGDGNLSGFTLVEVLFAIFIFVIVISSVYGAYRSTFHVIDAARGQLRLANESRRIISLISEDLYSLVLGPDAWLEGRKENSAANGISLEFLASSFLALKKTENTHARNLVKYYVRENTGNGFALYRLQTPIMPGVEVRNTEKNGYLVARQIKNIEFRYTDTGSTEHEEWRKKKEDLFDGIPIALPSAITIILTLFPDEENEDVTFSSVVLLPSLTENSEVIE